MEDGRRCLDPLRCWRDNRDFLQGLDNSLDCSLNRNHAVRGDLDSLRLVLASIHRRSDATGPIDQLLLGVWNPASPRPTLTGLPGAKPFLSSDCSRMATYARRG